MRARGQVVRAWGARGGEYASSALTNSSRTARRQKRRGNHYLYWLAGPGFWPGRSHCRRVLVPRVALLVAGPATAPPCSENAPRRFCRPGTAQELPASCSCPLTIWPPRARSGNRGSTSGTRSTSNPAGAQRCRPSPRPPLASLRGDPKSDGPQQLSCVR